MASLEDVYPKPIDQLIDPLIEELLAVKNSKIGTLVKVDGEKIAAVVMLARDIFMSQPMLLTMDAPINVCGDTHGQYYDLLRLFEIGDYVDRSNQSIETMLLLLCYKCKYPEKVWLLRGNHECASINRIYGFYDECKRRYTLLAERLEKINSIKRPCDIPDFGLLCDLLWSDPDPDIQGWGMNDRGVSYTFGSDVTIKFSHQVIEDAPNYCGEFDNAGGM
eukprot:GSMAST32.ASY1.ANO1.2440.1 assembled CDS